ncbi:MAG TPA: hypothetical protein VG366_03105 [Solirubrobacteraceae bacterium]|nr:hypothetical protein [Solirubrobacteraceae bacterium]
MAKRNTPRGRSRKRRRSTTPPGASSAGERGATLPQAEADVAADVAAGTGTRTEPRRREQARVRAGRPGGMTDALSVGERPNAPWHPFPLSELLILVGIIGAVIAWSRGVQHGGTALLIASIACVMIGTIEVTLREHLSGFRSHAILLSVLPPLAMHSAVVLTTQAETTVPRWLNVALLPLDGALFWFLYRLLRSRFQDARRERTFAGRR